MLDPKSSVNRRASLAAALIQAETALATGRAVLSVTADNESPLTAAYQGIQFYSIEEIARKVRGIYYYETIQALETEINRQWPFKVRVSDYVMIGKRGWAVVSRSGNEIIFYPYDKVCNWYLLETKDGGKSWDIAWRGDQAPWFQVDFPTENSAIVITSAGVHYSVDGGNTWSSY